MVWICGVPILGVKRVTERVGNYEKVDVWDKRNKSNATNLDDDDDDLVFYIPFDTIQTLSRWLKSDIEKLCDMENFMVIDWIPPPMALESGTSWSEVRSANHSATQMLQNSGKLFTLPVYIPYLT